MDGTTMYINNEIANLFYHKILEIACGLISQTSVQLVNFMILYTKKDLSAGSSPHPTFYTVEFRLG